MTLLRLMVALASTTATIMTTAAAPPAADSETLLKAINFALLGSDDRVYSWRSVGDCVVVSEADNPNFRSVEVLHLNNVDAARLRVGQYSLSFKDGHTEHYVKVELHGEDTIRDYALQNKAAGETSLPEPSSTTSWEYTRQTLEHDRMVRAWRYVYAHGCKSAHSSF